MLVRGGIAALRGLFDSIFRPEEYVALQQSTYTGSRYLFVSQLVKLTLVYLANLLLYAVPLTLSGVGFEGAPAAPAGFLAVVGPFVRNPEAAWVFAFSLYRNSFFITGMVGVVLVTYHASVVYFRASRGFLQSFHTVVYTSSVYLAGIYTITTFLSTTPGVDRAEQFALAIQQYVFVSIVNTLNPILPTALEVPFQQPERIPTSGFSPTGRLMLALLFLMIAYFLYTLYLGTRINHQSNRLQALTVVLGVMAAPIAYVAGSALFSAIVLPFLIQ